MITAGFEITAATRLIAPIVKELYQGAKGSIEGNFKKWNASAFPQRLAKKIAVTDKVKTIWSPDKDASLLSFYYPSQIIRNGQENIQIDKASDLGTDNIVVEGIVGQGKSIFLRYLCLTELLGKGSGRIPLFLELRTMVPGQTLRQYLYQALEKLDLQVDDEVFDYLANSGKLVLMLDGFDELDSKLVKTTISDLEYLIEKYEQLQIIITSRPENDIQKSRLFKVVKISLLDEQDYSGFLAKLDLPSDRRIEVMKAIKESPSRVSDLVNTPLLLTLLVMVYESEKEIPSELPEFFEKLFHVVFTKHDKLKAGFRREHHSGLSERKLQELFEAFCCMVMQNEFGRSLTSDQFNTAFSGAQEYSDGCVCEADSFRKDITKVACLMLEEGFNQVTFLHKGILEYYTASFIKHASDDVAKTFYDAALLNCDPWLEVLFFLQKIDPYRHARYFTIPASKKLLGLLAFINSNTAEKDAVDFLDKYFKLLTFKYQRNGLTHSSSISKKPYYIGSWGPFIPLNEPIGLLDRDLRNRLIAGIKGALPSTLTEAEILETPGIYIKGEGKEDEYIIAIKSILKEFDIAPILKELVNLELSVTSQLESAEALTNQEEKKKLIFQRKRKA